MKITDLFSQLTPAMQEYRALAVLQPWAWLISRPDILDPVKRQEAINAGLIKIIENRTWTTTYRGQFLIHAGQRYPKSQYLSDVAEIKRTYGVDLPPFEEMERGGIVGITTLSDCVHAHSSPWKMEGYFGFVLKDTQPVRFIPYKGQQGWFTARIPGLEVLSQNP